MPYIRAESDRSDAHWRSRATSSVGPTAPGDTRGRIVMAGRLDAEAVDQLAAHLSEFIEAGIRFITLDAHDVVGADPLLVPLLGRVQRRLTRRHGLLTLIGLRRGVLPTGGAPGNAPRGHGERADPATVSLAASPASGGRG